MSLTNLKGFWVNPHIPAPGYTYLHTVGMNNPVDKVEPFLFLSIRNLKPKLKLFSNSCQHFSIEFGPGVSKPGTSKISKSILCFKPKDLADVIEVGHGIFAAHIVPGRSDKSEGGPYKNRFWHGGGGSGQLKTVKFKVFYLAFFEI